MRWPVEKNVAGHAYDDPAGMNKHMAILFPYLMMSVGILGSLCVGGLLGAVAIVAGIFFAVRYFQRRKTHRQEIDTEADARAENWADDPAASKWDTGDRRK